MDVEQLSDADVELLVEADRLPRRERRPQEKAQAAAEREAAWRWQRDPMTWVVVVLAVVVSILWVASH